MALFSIAIAAVSCSNDKDLYDPNHAVNSKADEIRADYEAEFVRQFGTIAPGHNWGFTETRAGMCTRGTQPNANEWGGYADVPAPLTDEQKAVVTKWFSEHKNPQGTTVSWCDYFGQQVSSTDYGRQMDRLFCYSNTGESDHFGNFNGGDLGTNGDVWGGELTNPDDPNSKVFHSDKIQYMIGVWSDDFGFHNSLDSREYRNYVIIPGSEISPLVDGMYFLGFDYESHGQNANQQVEADGYYNDWIIRIAPGTRKSSENKGAVYRIIAEDLGHIGDFDFNDVVFDVLIENGNTALITLRAAGGTMPLYIGDVEVHEKLGVETGTMVNTGSGSVSRPVAIFRIPVSTGNINDIPVKVNNNGTEILLTTDPGKAPAKICVSADYRWAIERTSIKTAYPAFTEYVANPSLAGWYSNPVAGTVVE